MDIESRRGSITRIDPEIDVSSGSARELSNIRAGVVNVVRGVEMGEAVIDHDPSFREYEPATRRVRVGDAKQALVTDAVKQLAALEALVVGHVSVNPDCGEIAEVVKAAIADARRLIGAPLADIRSRLVRPNEAVQPAYAPSGDIRSRFIRGGNNG